MKPTNQFRNGIEPKRQEPKQKLNPPKFEYAPIDMRNPHIAWFTSLVRMDKKTGFNI